MGMAGNINAMNKPSKPHLVMTGTHPISSGKGPMMKSTTHLGRMRLKQSRSLRGSLLFIEKE